jgi:hypothetical protein
VRFLQKKKGGMLSKYQLRVAMNLVRSRFGGDEKMAYKAVTGLPGDPEDYEPCQSNYALDCEIAHTRPFLPSPLIDPSSF